MKNYKVFKQDLEHTMVGRINITMKELFGDDISVTYNSVYAKDLGYRFEKEIKQELKNLYPVIKIKKKDIHISTFWEGKHDPMETYLKCEITLPQPYLNKIEEIYPESLI